MWLDEKNFAGLIRRWWQDFLVGGRAGFRLASKLKKDERTKIKEWVKPWMKILAAPYIGLGGAKWCLAGVAPIGACA